jgi:hypothetical protein
MLDSRIGSASRVERGAHSSLTTADPVGDGCRARGHGFGVATKQCVALRLETDDGGGCVSNAIYAILREISQHITRSVTYAVLFTMQAVLTNMEFSIQGTWSEYALARHPSPRLQTI